MPVDWNNATQPGVYLVNPDNPTGQTNTAIAALGLYAWGQVVVSSAGNYTSIRQVYYSHTGGIAVRQSYNGGSSWLAWKQIATTDMIKGTNVWVSGEYTYTSNTPLIVSHGLTITPLNCRAEVLLKCTTAEGGYSIGDYAIGAMIYSGANLFFAPTPLLTSSSVQINPGAATQGFIGINKSNGSYALLTNTKWCIIFRIWY